MLPEQSGIKLIEFFKFCAKCGNSKRWTKFSKRKNRACGIASTCKKCSKIRIEAYRKIHKKEILSQTNFYAKSYRKTHKNEIKIRNKAYRKANKDKRKIYCIANKDKIKAQTKIYHKTNKKKLKISLKNWRTNNKEKIKNYGKTWSKNRRRVDPKFKLNDNISTAIGYSLKSNKNGRHWEDIVGYTLEKLVKHLEKLFTNGMSWKNYGEWHVDHKIPKSVFNFTSVKHEDFKKCWALENLQPLWAKDNISKYNKLDKPFQPSLLI